MKAKFFPATLKLPINNNDIKYTFMCIKLATFSISDNLEKSRINNKYEQSILNIL